MLVNLRTRLEAPAALIDDAVPSDLENVVNPQTTCGDAVERSTSRPSHLSQPSASRSTRS